MNELRDQLEDVRYFYSWNDKFYQLKINIYFPFVSGCLVSTLIFYDLWFMSSLFTVQNSTYHEWNDLAVAQTGHIVFINH